LADQEGLASYQWPLKGSPRANSVGDLNIQFFWARGIGPCLGSPVPSGQKRNYLERYVETESDRFSSPPPYPGAIPSGSSALLYGV